MTRVVKTTRGGKILTLVNNRCSIKLQVEKLCYMQEAKKTYFLYEKNVEEEKLSQR